jgi:hypothetical protein
MTTSYTFLVSASDYGERAVPLKDIDVNYFAILQLSATESKVIKPNYNGLHCHLPDSTLHAFK